MASVTLGTPLSRSKDCNVVVVVAVVALVVAAVAVLDRMLRVTGCQEARCQTGQDVKRDRMPNATA